MKPGVMNCGCHGRAQKTLHSILLSLLCQRVTSLHIFPFSGWGIWGFGHFFGGAEGPWRLSVPPSQVLVVHFTGIYGALAVPGIRAKSHCSGVDAWLRKTSQWLNRYLHYDLRLGSLEFLYPREENRQAMLAV